ncbi:MAG: prepilin peptidase [Oscillospiraceae bacterium]|nr:prepilin peptidase [Oscillospiraceae bacterium]
MDLFLSYLFLYFMVFCFGIAIGSFLNVCIYRLPKEESLVNGASHCMTCNEKIKKRDLIPVISWCLLRGKCRNCKAPISPRYTVVEFLTGVLFVLVFLYYGVDVNPLMASLTSLMFAALVVVFFMDWDTQLISTPVVIFIGFLGILQMLGNQFFDKPLSDLTIKSQLLGALVISVPFFLIELLSKGKAMGRGDVYLMIAGGLFVGVKAVVIAAFIGMVTGSVVGMILKHKTGSSKFAFGPFLSLGLAISALYGNQLADLYLKWSGFIQ